MALQLNDSIGSTKAATGPNPQSGAGSLGAALGYAAVTGTGRSGINQAVNSPGPSPITPTQQQPVQPASTPITATGTTYDYTSDPALQMVMAQQTLAIQQAQAAALAQQKAALIAYGDPNLAMAILGDQATADAAAGNTGSTLATLAAQNAQSNRNINENENKANLFYSSDRGYQLGLAQQAYLQNQGQAASTMQGNLGTIQNNLLAQEQSAYNTESQAQNDAYNRAVQAAQQAESQAQMQAYLKSLTNPVGVPSTNAPPPSSGGGGDQGGGLTPAQVPTNQYGGPNPPIAANTPAPATKTAPYTTPVTANKTGGSANLKQGVFAIH